MIAIINSAVYCIGVLTISVVLLAGLCLLFFEPIFLRKEHRSRKALHASALDGRLVLFEEDAINYRFIATDDLSLKIILNKNNEQLFLYDGAGKCLLNEYPSNKNPSSVIGIIDRKYSRKIRIKLKDLTMREKYEGLPY